MPSDHSRQIFFLAFTALVACQAPTQDAVPSEPSSSASPTAPVAPGDAGAAPTTVPVSADADAPAPVFQRATFKCDPAEGANDTAAFQGAIIFDRSRYLDGDLPSTAVVSLDLRHGTTTAATMASVKLDVLLSSDATHATAYDLGGSGLRVELDFHGGLSTVHAADGSTFTAQCAPVATPVGVDLVADETVKNAAADLTIDVTNFGTQPLALRDVRVLVDDEAVTASLHTYGPAGGATIAPNGRGYLVVAGHALPECTSHYVTLDIDHVVQSGAPDPSGNDIRKVNVACPLRWTTPITKESFGREPPAWLAGKTLDDIVSSRVSGRPDRLLCSACHYDGATYPYAPKVAGAGTSEIGPADIVGSVAWRGAGGWAGTFETTSIKPQDLRDAFARWLVDGAL